MQRPLRGNDPQTTLQLMEHALSESMYIKDLTAIIA